MSKHEPLRSQFLDQNWPIFCINLWPLKASANAIGSTESGGFSISVRAMSVFFWALLAFSFILALTIAILHSGTFLAWSNYAQIFTAAACAVACAYAFRFQSKDLLLLLAGFAFGGWALSNVFWYSYVAILGQSLMYPTISESGFLGFMLFLAAGYQIAFPRIEGRGFFSFTAAFPFLAVPIAVVHQMGLTPATAVTSLNFAIQAYLVGICVRSSPS